MPIRLTLNKGARPSPSVPAPLPKLAWLFKPLERPSYADSLSFPDDLSVLTSSQVSLLLGRYTAMHAYALSELSMVSVDEKRLETEIELAKNQTLRDALNKGQKVSESRRAVAASLTLEKLHKTLGEVSAKKTHISSFAAIYDKYCSALSRELSRKSSEMGHLR